MNTNFVQRASTFSVTAGTALDRVTDSDLALGKRKVLKLKSGGNYKTGTNWILNDSKAGSLSILKKLFGKPTDPTATEVFRWIGTGFKVTFGPAGSSNNYQLTVYEK